jgi:glycosyltransferase involved in cell wall biosynthesis
VRFVIAGQVMPGYEAPQAPQLPDGGQFEEIHAYISNTQLATLFAAADVVVCPYTDASQSGVVLSAYGFEKPVIATRVGGLPEYVQDGTSGLLIPPNDPQALTSAIVNIVRDQSLRRKLESGVRDLVRERNWTASARAMLDVYCRAANDNHCSITGTQRPDALYH